MASASASYRRAADQNNTNEEAENTTNETLATGGGGGGPGDIKPRSLRFTWSMKTTSSMDPADMIKEIRKVNFFMTQKKTEIEIFHLGSRYK